MWGVAFAIVTVGAELTRRAGQDVALAGDGVAGVIEGLEFDGTGVATGAGFRGYWRGRLGHLRGGRRFGG